MGSSYLNTQRPRLVAQTLTLRLKSVVNVVNVVNVVPVTPRSHFFWLVLDLVKNVVTTREVGALVLCRSQDLASHGLREHHALGEREVEVLPDRDSSVPRRGLEICRSHGVVCLFSHCKTQGDSNDTKQD